MTSLRIDGAVTIDGSRNRGPIDRLLQNFDLHERVIRFDLGEPTPQIDVDRELADADLIQRAVVKFARLASFLSFAGRPAPDRS